MNESETRAELIDPALRAAGWVTVSDSFVRREYHITKGRLIGNGKREKPAIADYLLVYRNRIVGIIEAKAETKHYTEGLGQAKLYAGMMQVRYTYCTNGHQHYQVDMHEGREGDCMAFPTPDELWELTYGTAEATQPIEEIEWRERLLSVPFEDRGGTWQPRYYQDTAITRVLEGVAEGKQRMLLTLATGTGKTAIAFQIAWKLFQSKWNINRDGQRHPRILFLADRNILANQAFNSFSAFEEEALVRIKPSEIKKKGKVPKNGSVFFTIFQTFMSGPNDTPYFGEYPKDFFDFIIIDECHRGGANDESNWRAIMDYFSPATQLGLTATPKRDVNGDTYKYFGEPVYVYSLKEGINDGFLTPFKVQEIKTTIDDYVYTNDDSIEDGELEEGKRYVEADFNRIIEIKEREAYRVKLLMERVDQNHKTIVFCATQKHALAVRDLINQMATSRNANYCHRVTADDGALGEQHLKDFQDNEKRIPTVLTTSQKLSTGVDAPEVRNIVLMRPVNSMVEFKQIIGRGTRLFEGKDYFTIYDFVEAHHHFSDPAWDGEPMEPVPPIPRPIKPIEDYDIDDDDRLPGFVKEPDAPRRILKIKLADGKIRELQHMTRTSFWSPDGKPISSQQFLESMFGALPSLFGNEEELRTIWSRPDTRKKLLEELQEKGYPRAQLQELQNLIQAENSDLYDVLSYVAFHSTPLERTTRAARARVHLNSYNPKQQAFLDFVLQQYVQSGIDELDDIKLPRLLELKYHAIADAKHELGDIKSIRETFVGFQSYLYEKEAI